MKFPVELTIGTFSISLHAMLESLGIFIGFRYFLHQRKKDGDSIAQTNRVWIIGGAIVGALFGARLIGALEDPVKWSQSANLLFYFYENKTIVGGLLGGLAGVELTKVWIGERHSSGDLFVYPVILALIIGRLGCFSMGVYEETYGVSTRFPLGMDLGDGLKRHPVTLYEIFFLIVLYSGLKQLRRKLVLEPGALFKLFMILYLSFRFLLDFIKPHYTYAVGLSTIQLTCIGGLIYYRAFILSPKKLIAKTYA